MSNEPCYRQRLPDLNGPAARKTSPLTPGGATTGAKARKRGELEQLRGKLQPFGTREGVR